MYRASWDSLCLILANGLIQSSARNGSDPFRVVWYKGDTTESTNYLKSDAVVIGITYTPSSEKIVTNQGIAKSPVWYAWHDHLLLVGPTPNPANLSRTTDLKTMFSDLYGAAEGDDSEPPVRFLKRYDKSATSIKDSRPWIQTGKMPRATAHSIWYHQYITYPTQALTAAILIA